MQAYVHIYKCIDLNKIYVELHYIQHKEWTVKKQWDITKENLNKLTKLETIIPSKESRPQMANTASITSCVDISNKLLICLFQWKKHGISSLLWDKKERSDLPWKGE